MKISLAELRQIILEEIEEGRKASKKKGKPFGKRRRGKTESQAQQKAAGIALSAREKYGKKGAIKRLKGAPKSMAAMSMKDLRKLATIRRGSEVPDSTKKGHELAALPGYVISPKRTSESTVTRNSLKRLIEQEIIKELNPIEIMKDFFLGSDTDTAQPTCPRVNNWKEVHPALSRVGIISPDEAIVVLDGPSQKMRILNADSVIRTFECSTGAAGFGNESGSEKTSTGLMEISEKVGSGEPEGMVFKSLKPTGYVLGPNEGKKAWVLTRALLLLGLQPKNRNVRSRSIYIHGTNRERILGTPASGGCIRLSNNNILWAFNTMPIGTKVYILGSPNITNPKFPCGDDELTESYDRGKDNIFESGDDETATIIYGEPEGIEPDTTA